MEKLTQQSCATGQPLPNNPLQIRVTEPARENLILRVLVRRAIPILKNPEAYSRETRLGLAQSLCLALGGSDQNVTEDRTEEQGPPHSDADAPSDALDIPEECPCPYASCEMEWT